MCIHRKEIADTGQYKCLLKEDDNTRTSIAAKHMRLFRSWNDARANNGHVLFQVCPFKDDELEHCDWYESA